MAACQSNTPGSLEQLKYDQWKVIYKACIKAAVHENAAIAIHIDVAAVSRACDKLAKDRLNRSAVRIESASRS